ncbi:MAG TPA: sugar transferase [Anaerolineales bacterium]|nr:sugar transferase [Anaerolineales bacterium]
MLRRFSINFALFSMLLDALSTALALWLSATLRPLLNSWSFIREVSDSAIVPPPLYVIFPLVWVLISAALSIYDGRKFLRAADELAALFLSTFIASISTAGILYFSFREVSRALFVLFVGITFLLCFFWRALARVYFRTRRELAPGTRRLLVVGTGRLAQDVEQQIRRSRWESLSLVGFVESEAAPVTRNNSLGRLPELKALVSTHQVTDVVIAVPYSAYHQMGEIVTYLEDLPVGVWIALGFFDLALYRTDIEDFAGIPMLDLRASAMDDYQRLMKRAFDLFAGLVLLVPALPFMALVALLVLLEDGSPVLFRQKRVGENGRLFEMLKFRTMVRNAEELQGLVEKRDADGNLIHKMRDDPRVTRVGRLLRRLSLDELPQLFNILTGTMSLVGPRPELPYLVDSYQPWQRKRFAVPPGLTGWWQVNGRSDKPMHLHTEDDLYYIQNYSIWLDLQIIVRTIWVVLIGNGSY